MPALLTRTSRDPTPAAAARICAASVTSSISGVTRASACANGSRVPTYTSSALLFRASSTSARPMPRLPPVTRTVLSAMLAMMTISFSCGGAGLTHRYGLGSARCFRSEPLRPQPVNGPPGPSSGDRFCERRYEPAPLRASAKGVPAGWNLRCLRPAPRCHRGSALTDHAQFSRPGDGLGAVGGAQLAQDVADVLFDREDGDEQLLGDVLVRHARG